MSLNYKQCVEAMQQPEFFTDPIYSMNIRKQLCEILKTTTEAKYKEYLQAIKQGEIEFKDIPHEYITTELCMEAVQLDGLQLAHIPAFYDRRLGEVVQGAHYYQCLEAVKQNGLALQFVPLIYKYRDIRTMELRTMEMCLEAVKQNGLALQFVPKKYKEICATAFNQNKDSIKFLNSN